MECLIRLARNDDMLDCLAMGALFHAETEHAAYIPYDVPTVERNARMCLDSGVLLVAEADGILVGVVGLILAPSIFNDNVLCAYEAIWYVAPSAQLAGIGKALFYAVEPACKAKGVKVVHMIHLANSPPQAAALYERGGYHHAESTWIKVI